MSGDRDAILKRRMCLLSAALAGLASSGCPEDSPPQVCLLVPLDYKPSATAEPSTAEPRVCLSQLPDEPKPDPTDAGADAGADAGTDAGAPPDAGALVTKPVPVPPPPPRPRVCLSRPMPH